MNKTLITGSAGFLAQHIIRDFQTRGDFTIGVDKRPERYHSNYFIQSKIEDIGFRDLMGVDTVVHLGWRTNIPDCIRHPVESTEDNILMTVKLFERCVEAGVKTFIFPSTASLYAHNKTPWSEEMTAMPIEPYSWQKFACEEYLKMQSSNMRIIIPRLFQVFGECQRSDTAIAAFIENAKKGKPVTLTETVAQSTFKSGQRDFIYAGDVASAFVVLDKKGTPGVYNICTGHLTTMEDVAKALKATIEWIPRRQHEVECHLGDNRKMVATGWKPKVDVIKWLQKQI